MSAKQKVVHGRGPCNINLVLWRLLGFVTLPLCELWVGLTRLRRHPLHVLEIWKTRPSVTDADRPFWISVWGKLGQKNHVIIMASSFSKTSVFKMFSEHAETLRRSFQIPPVRRAFPKSFVFYGVVWTGNELSSKVIYFFLDQMVCLNNDAWYPLRTPCITTDQIVCLCDPLSSDEQPPAKQTENFNILNFYRCAKAEVFKRK